MRDQHEGRALLGVEAEHEFGDLGPGVGVEIAGRFIGEDDAWLGHEGTRDRHTLLLATGELLRAVVEPFGQAHPFQPVPGACLGISHPSQIERQHDVFQGRQRGQQLKRLEDEADPALPARGQFILGERTHGFAMPAHPAAVGTVQTGQQAEQGGLARARGPHDGQAFTGGHLERHRIEDRERVIAQTHDTGESFGLDRGLTGKRGSEAAAVGEAHVHGGLNRIKGMGLFSLMHTIRLGARGLALAVLLLFGLMAAQAQTRPTLLILGDSLSAGYGLARGEGWVELLERKLEREKVSVQVVNASVSGETTAGGLARLPALLERHKPRYVVIELGGNDGLRGAPPSTIRQNLIAMAERARASGARVLILGMRLPPNLGPAYTQAFEASFREAAQRTGSQLVPFFLEALGTDLTYFQPDRIHPTAAAQPKMLETVWPALKQLLR